MADTALEDLTGQAGVSISIADIAMDFSIGYVAWGDGDGFDAPAGTDYTPGYISMNNITMLNITLDAYDPVNAIQKNTVLVPQFLTIDVGEYPIGFDTTTNAYIMDTAVRIGVPTLNVKVGTIEDITVALQTAGDVGGSSIETKDTLGTISMGSLELDTKGGAIFILAH
jgi:hypothetical protein